MQFTEMGLEDGKTMVLLPGTACTWQINFARVIDELAKRYHLICVNYDGFEGDPSICFTSVPEVCAKIEDYLIEHHGGHVDGAYGSSLGGSFAALLVQRGRVHVDHAFIGSSDLDQGSPIVARIMTMIVGPMLSGAAKSEKKRQKLVDKLAKALYADEDSDEMRTFLEAFAGSFANMHPKTITREYYSDYVTPLANGIHQDGTTIHVIHALRMDPKGEYKRRYLQHFREPNLMPFDMQHEEWLFGSRWTDTVLAAIDEKMGVTA